MNRKTPLKPLLCTPFLRAPWLLLGLWSAVAGGIFVLAAGQEFSAWLWKAAHTENVPQPASFAIRTEKDAPPVADENVTSALSGPLTPLARRGGDAPVHVQDATVKGESGDAFTQPEALGGTLTAFTAEENPDAFFARFVLSAAAGAPAIRHVDRPVPAWVLDIRGKWQSAVPYRTELKGKVIRRIDVGRHEDFLRLVFYCAKGKDCANEEQPRVRRTEDGFVVWIGRKKPNPECSAG